MLKITQVQNVGNTITHETYICLNKGCGERLFVLQASHAQCVHCGSTYDTCSKCGKYECMEHNNIIFKCAYCNNQVKRAGYTTQNCSERKGKKCYGYKFIQIKDEV